MPRRTSEASDAVHDQASDAVHDQASDVASDPRWLDPTELEAWMAFTTVMMRLPGALSRQLQRDSGLTHFEYLVLAGLSDAPGRTLRMSVLAEFTQAQLPRLSQVAARMEKRGWLIRRPDPTDGRFTLAELTDAGMAMVVAAAPGHVEAVRRLVIDPLTAPQIRHLGEIGARLRSTLDAESTDRAGAESTDRAGAESTDRAGAESTDRAGVESGD